MILSASLSIIFIILLSHQPSSATPINTTIVNDDCENNDKIVSVYDERQNGSENVRVNVKDVLFVWAPEDKINSEFLDYPANEEVPQNPVGSNEIQKPTSIIDILNSFQESSVTYSSTQKPNVNNNSLSGKIFFLVSPLFILLLFF